MATSEHQPYQADEHRSSFIGASECAAVLNASQYEQPLDVYNRKLGIAPEKTETDLMMMGKLFEPAILTIYQNRTGYQVSPNNNTIIHSDYPFIGATPDAMVESPDGVVFPLDAKNSSRYRDGWGPDGSEEVPLDIFVQMQQQMLVVGAERADVAALLDGRTLNIYTVYPSPKIQRAIVRKCSELWDRIQRQDPPPLQYECDSTVEILRQMHEGTEAVAIELPELAAKAWAERQELKEQIKELEKEAEMRERVVEYALASGGAQVGYLDESRQINWKKRKRKGYTVEPAEYLEIRETKRKG